MKIHTKKEMITNRHARRADLVRMCESERQEMLKIMNQSVNEILDAGLSGIIGLTHNRIVELMNLIRTIDAELEILSMADE